MDFTYVEFPCTLDINTFKAYFNLSHVKLPKIHGKSLQVNENEDENSHHFKSLRHLVLDTIVENWSVNPILQEIPRQEDRNYILSHLDVNLPLQTLSAHIRDDFFWRKCYQHRWKTCRQQQQKEQQEQPQKLKPWINIYMERHLQEFIENVETGDYDQESVQVMLDVCAAYINQLEINRLQPAADGHNDHIPLDFILSNLPELRVLRLTYATKTVGTNFFLGCNTLSQNDTILLAKGLSRSHELVNFRLFNTKLQAYQLRFIARSLDKGCHNLSELSLVHCALGDEGIRQFLESCHKESFSTLKVLELTNNKISPEGAFLLSRALGRLSLTKLVLRLNALQSDGVAAIFTVLYYLPITHLDISGCSVSHTITKLFMQLIVQNKTLLHIDISNNVLTEDFGKHLFKIIGFNKILEWMDLRNTGVSLELRNKFKNVLHGNIVRKRKKGINTVYN